MSENEKIISKIIADFDETMAGFEMRDAFAALYGKNPPAAQEIYARQKQLKAARAERRDALRRVLWVNLGTEDELSRMFPTSDRGIELEF